MSRTVTLVLVDSCGAALGALPPFEVEVPWWPEAGDVVEAARERVRGRRDRAAVRRQ